MYLTMVKQWFSTLYHTVWRRHLMRSGLITALILALVLIGLAAAYRQHMQGKFHLLKLKANIETQQEDSHIPRPGGQEPIVLTRAQTMGDSLPEFLSATMLPGRGMNVLQITAYIPGKGEVKLLASPTAEAAARMMTGKGADADGEASLTMGGAFEVPWAARIWGTPAQEGGHISTVWRGHTITLPAAAIDDASVAGDGLMLATPSDSAQTAALPDGGDAEAVFHAGDFRGHWPSKTDVTVTVLLSSRSIDLTIEAHNTGDAAEPIGIGWHPRFAILDGNRQQMRLRVPGSMRLDVRNHDQGQPTGALLPVAGTPFDFAMDRGARLGTMDLDDCFVALRQNLLDNGPIAELSDPSNNYGIRLIALSPTIKAMRVVAPERGDFVSIGPQLNYDDPFGREWGKNIDTGMVVLQPKQSVQWKVRLEVFSLTGPAAPL